MQSFTCGLLRFSFSQAWRGFPGLVCKPCREACVIGLPTYPRLVQIKTSSKSSQSFAINNRQTSLFEKACEASPGVVCVTELAPANLGFFLPDRTTGPDMNLKNKSVSDYSSDLSINPGAAPRADGLHVGLATHVQDLDSCPALVPF